MNFWFRISFPRIKDTMLFLYSGVTLELFRTIDGSRSFSFYTGIQLSGGWDGEFGGPDLQLWVYLGFFRLGFGIETNPYIKKIFESGR